MNRMTYFLGLVIQLSFLLGQSAEASPALDQIKVSSAQEVMDSRSSLVNRTEAVRSRLKSTLAEFNELAVDLPFGRLYRSWREKVREQYKEGARQLTGAIQQVSDSPKAAMQQVRLAHGAYREIGLLMPFYEVETSKVNEIISRYLIALDSLETVALQLSTGAPVGPAPTPVPIGIWRNGQQTWTLIGNAMTLSDAVEGCRELNLPNSSDWHLPTLRELAQSFRAMKDPARNRVFGDRASKLVEVWTVDEKAPNLGYYYVNFQREETGVSAEHVKHAVICVGLDQPN